MIKDKYQNLCLTHTGFRPLWNIVSTHKVTNYIPWRTGHYCAKSTHSVWQIKSMSHQSKTHLEQNPAWNTYLISWSVSGLKGCPSDKLQAQEGSFISHRSRELKEILQSIADVFFLHHSAGLMTWPWGVFQIKSKLNETKFFVTSIERKSDYSLFQWPWF